MVDTSILTSNLCFQVHQKDMGFGIWLGFFFLFSFSQKGQCCCFLIIIMAITGFM